jgi:3-oxoacyl-[acyl-carrier-protein] synthase-3
MGTTIEEIRVVQAGPHSHHDALWLADAAGKECLESAGVLPTDVDLLINAGLYRDRILGEPALASLVQEDIGINPEDPHQGGHGSFSFDVANGACGALTALQLADRFLQAGTIRKALIVSSDADPGHRLASSFPFRPAGGAVLCVHDTTRRGLLGHVHWTTVTDERHAWRATVGSDGGHNRLHIEMGPTFCDDAGVAAAKVAAEALAAGGLTPDDLAVVVAAPAYPTFVRSFTSHSDIDPERVITSGDERLHTVSLVAALDYAHANGLLTRNGIALLVCAGSGITAGAALYRS